MNEVTHKIPPIRFDGFWLQRANLEALRRVRVQVNRLDEPRHVVRIKRVSWRYAAVNRQHEPHGYWIGGGEVIDITVCTRKVRGKSDLGPTILARGRRGEIGVIFQNHFHLERSTGVKSFEGCAIPLEPHFNIFGRDFDRGIRWNRPLISRHRMRTIISHGRPRWPRQAGSAK